MTIALIILSILLVAVLGISYTTYRMAFYNPQKGRDALPSTNGPQYDPYREMMKLIYSQLAQREFQPVTLTNREGMQLFGRYYHVADGAPLCIGFHGYRSSPYTDFSGGSGLCFQMGQNLLLVDQRAHGKSQGNTISFGIRECEDCRDWIGYALNRFGPDTQILLYGISMGAATVLMASGLELPENVKGIVADCPYASASEIICKVANDMNLPSKLAYPFLLLGARIFGGFDLEKTDAIRAVQRSKIPILLIHGEADSFVPCDMSLPIAEANPDMVTRHTFPAAEHGISFLVDTPRYTQLVEEFTRQVLQS